MRTVHVPQRILLTGATGVLGRQLLPTLAGWRAPIRVLAHRIDPLPTPSLPLERHRGDLEHPVTLHGMAEDCDLVVHAAARPGFGTLDRERQRKINVAGTLAVLHEAESAGAKTFVYLGYTGTVQEREERSGSVDEEAPPEGEYESETVRMKYEAEAAVLEANRAGFRTIVVSPGVLVAPGSPTMLGGLVGAYLRRELPYRFLDDVWLAVSGGKDVARCVVAAVEHGLGGRRYFATGECLRLGDLYARLTRLTGVPGPRRRLPDLLVEELGLLTPVLPPHSFLRQLVLPRELVVHLRRLAPLTNARTRAELGFVPTPLADLLLEAGRFEGALSRDVAGAAG